MAIHLRLSVGLLLMCSVAAFAAPMPSNTLYLGTTRATPEAALSAYRARRQAQGQALARYRQLLVQAKAISPRTVMPKIDSFVVSQPTTRATTLRQAPVGGGTLTFNIADDGANVWTPTERQLLTDFLNRAYPVLVAIYGQPASTATLRVVPGLAPQWAEGGEFDPQTMTLRLEQPVPSDLLGADDTHYGTFLLHLVLHAFRAPATIGFDAWEEGMTRAAAMLAMMSPTLHGAAYEPFRDFFYLIELYDFFNQPALATKTFFPTQGMDLMMQWRIGMATSAWLKVYAERANSSIFREFNTQYYARYSTDPSIAGDLNALKVCMASALGAANGSANVEGLPFADWYARQYVLQPLVTVDTQLFVYPVPLDEHIALIAQYFRSNVETDTQGQQQVTETPLTGIADLTYTTWDGIALSPEEGNQMTIGDIEPGFGTLMPGFNHVNDQHPLQRIDIAITVQGSGKRNVVRYPYMGRWGTLGDPALDDGQPESQVFGALVGADEGTLSISIAGQAPQQLNVTQGAFSLPPAAITGFVPITLSFTSLDGKVTTVRRNAGPSFYALPLTVEEGAVILHHTFPRGLSLVSFPLALNEADAADPAAMFGYTGAVPADFQFARWDPTLTTENKYRYYPALDGPIQPARAYWVNLPEARTVAAKGTALSSYDARPVTLQRGWNMVGNSYNADISPWSMQVRVGSVSLPLSQAIARGAVGPIWTYDASIGAYTVEGRLQAWEGAWIDNLTGGELELVQPSAARGAVRATDGGDEVMRLLTQGGWGFALHARSGRMEDGMAVLGVASGARRGVDGLDWLKPPAMGGGVRIAFVNPENQVAGGRYATDIRGELPLRGDQWEFDVTSGQSEDVTLTWPDLRKLPAQYQAVLEDLATGARRYLRTSPAYSYQARGSVTTPDVRRFRISIEPRDTAPLSFLDVRVLQRRGKGADVRVMMSGDANLLMDVRSPTGKLLRRINAPATRGSESVTISWDGRANGGSALPAGIYLLQLTAQTPEGYTIRRAQTVIVK